VALFGAYDLARESIMNLPQAIKILSDAFTIIKPLAKNELSVAAVVSGYFKK
jgi:squalene monooxygenase